MKLLDLFCGAGGATKGYQEAGFYVVGVDIKAQPRYIGDEFIQADALEFIAQHGHEFDVIHTSPPCQFYSVTASLSSGNHPDLVGPVRDSLLATGKPYIIENVPGAPLINPIMLCGSMFPGLRVYRHRLFEANPPIYWPPAACNHSFKMPASKGAYHTLKEQEFITCVGHNFQAKSGQVAMQIDWMTRDEMAQAIPPAYTKWIGEKLLEILNTGF